MRDLNFESTPCRHAQALSQAFHRIKDVLREPASVAARSLRIYRGLSAGDEEVAEPSEVVVVEYAGMRGKNQATAVYVVYYSRVWTPVVDKSKKNPLKLAFCFSLSCLTQPYGCIRAKRVNAERKIDAAESSAAAAA